jgi:hypothetical protein
MIQGMDSLSHDPVKQPLVIVDEKWGEKYTWR